jgi:hypothetical protein
MGREGRLHRHGVHPLVVCEAPESLQAVKQAVLGDGDATLVRDGVDAGELGEAEGALFLRMVLTSRARLVVWVGARKATAEPIAASQIWKNPLQFYISYLQRKALDSRRYATTGLKPMRNEIEAIFETRGEAVRKEDRPLFLSTQVSEIELGGSSEGYLSLEDLITEVLYIHDESELEKFVLVKETYKQSGKDPRSAFLLYFLTCTVKGWRIYNLTSVASRF